MRNGTSGRGHYDAEVQKMLHVKSNVSDEPPLPTVGRIDGLEGLAARRTCTTPIAKRILAGHKMNGENRIKIRPGARPRTVETSRGIAK